MVVHRKKHETVHNKKIHTQRGFGYIISGLKFHCAINLATLTRKNTFQSLFESKH